MEGIKSIVDSMQPPLQEFSSSELPIINTPIKQQLVLKAELTKEDEIEAAAILDLLI